MRAEDVWAAHERERGFRTGCTATCMVIIMVGVGFLLLFAAFGSTLFVEPTTLLFIVFVAGVAILLLLVADRMRDRLQEPA